MVYVSTAAHESNRKAHTMAPVHSFDGICPVCGGDMVVTRFSCGRCGSSLEGVFSPAAAPAGTRAGQFGARADDARFGRLARLDATQLEFVEVFLRCRGVIKNVEDMLGISYPTVKARLASVLDAMGLAADDEQPDADRRETRRKILADLAAGQITTEDAHRLLAQSPESTKDADND